MILTVIRSRLRPEHQTEYADVAERVHALAQTMPGFVSIKTFTAEDGERVSIVEFQSWATHDAWREQADHRLAQQLGRDRFYAEFHIQVAEVDRDYRFAMHRPG